MKNDTNPATIAAAIKAIAGNHFAALEAEFVDFNNDMRVASTRELMDLGLDRVTADKCLFIVREAYVGKPVETALAEA